MLLGDKALDTGRTRPVRDGVTRWRWMVTCWEPKASFRIQRAQQAIPVTEWNITDTDATTVADSLDRSSEKTASNMYRNDNIWRVQE